MLNWYNPFRNPIKLWRDWRDAERKLKAERARNPLYDKYYQQSSTSIMGLIAQAAIIASIVQLILWFLGFYETTYYVVEQTLHTT